MSLFKSQLDAMSLYSPPLEGREKDGRVLLDFNERTVPVASVIEDALVKYIRSGKLQVYPAYGDVVEKIAAYSGVKSGKVMITNGSDQGIDLIFRAACSEGDEVIIPAPSFPMYTQAAQVENATIHQPHYSKDSGYPLDAVRALVNEKTRVIVVSNPNNPSGTLVSAADIEALAKAAPNSVILVDECYYEYCRETVVDAIDRCPNIMITRTFSKTWGLPSLRIGYVIAQPEYIQALCKIRGPYDINQLAVVAVQAAMDNQDCIADYLDEVMQHSKPRLEAFLQERDIPFWPSAGNFLWAFFDEPEKIERGLREQEILVRPKADADGKLGLRVTLGTQAQTDKLLAVLADLL
jgi:histidinol-phosphate aminotransferase